MKTEIIYFSATGTTKAIVQAIAQGLSGDVHFTDITLPGSRKERIIIDRDLTMIAVPIYGERIPSFLYGFLSQLRGDGKPLVVVSVYGNMGFGISLEQFEAFAQQNDFKLIAAGAFIGQHTYATQAAPVAYGRPDEQDLQQARVFGESIRKKMDAGSFAPISLPRSAIPMFVTKFPDSGTRFLIRQPRVRKDACNACGACARKCPVGAIDLKSLEICEQKCLRCYACVKSCPKNARVVAFRVPVFQTVFRRLGIKGKQNQTFL